MYGCAVTNGDIVYIMNSVQTETLCTQIGGLWIDSIVNQPLLQPLLNLGETVADLSVIVVIAAQFFAFFHGFKSGQTR